MSITTLSMSWGITTLNIRYSNSSTMAQVSRMLTARSHPAAWGMVFPSSPLIRCRPARMSFSNQLTMGASR